MIRPSGSPARQSQPSNAALCEAAPKMFRMLLRASAGVHPTGETARDIKALIASIVASDDPAPLDFPASNVGTSAPEAEEAPAGDGL